MYTREDLIEAIIMESRRTGSSGYPQMYWDHDWEDSRQEMHSNSSDKRLPNTQDIRNIDPLARGKLNTMQQRRRGRRSLRRLAKHASPEARAMWHKDMRNIKRGYTK